MQIRLPFGDYHDGKGRAEETQNKGLSFTNQASTLNQVQNQKSALHFRKSSGKVE